MNGGMLGEGLRVLSFVDDYNDDYNNAITSRVTTRNTTTNNGKKQHPPRQEQVPNKHHNTTIKIGD